jgi:hypothetical protein
MACEFLQARRVKLLNVPYKTTAAAMLAVASGEADTIFVDAGSSIAQWQTGRVRGSAVTSQERCRPCPSYPPRSEEGVPDYLMNAWYAAYVRVRYAPEHRRGDARDPAHCRQAAGHRRTTLTKYSMDPLPLIGDDLRNEPSRDRALVEARARQEHQVRQLSPCLRSS